MKIWSSFDYQYKLKNLFSKYWFHDYLCVQYRSIWPQEKWQKSCSIFLCVSVLSVKNAPFDMGAKRSIARIIGGYIKACSRQMKTSKKSCNKKILARDGRKFSSVVSENVWGDITAANFDSRRLLASLSTFLAQDAGDLSCFGCEI